MYRVPTSQLRYEIGAVVSRVEHARKRTITERRGKPVAAVAPTEDLAALEELEDRLDIEEAERILADPDTKWIPWEQVEAELDDIP